MKQLKLLFVLAIFLSSKTSYAQSIAHLLFMEHFSGESWELVYSLQPDKQSNGPILGYSSLSYSGNINSACGAGVPRIIFNKYNGAGEFLEWSRCYEVKEDSFYNYLLADNYSNTFIGSTWDPGGRKFLVKRENINGQTIWNKGFGGAGTEQLRDILAYDDGYVLFGETTSKGGDIPWHPAQGGVLPNFWVVKIDTAGSIIWSKVIGGTSYEEAKGIAEGPEKGFYIVGSTASIDYDCDCLNNNGQYYNAFVARLDSVGDIVWKRCLAGSVSGRGKALVADGKGGVYVGAKIQNPGGDFTGYKGGNDFAVAHIDSANNLLWAKCYGNVTGNEEIESMCMGTDGTVWLAGSCSAQGGDVYASFGGPDAWIVNIDQQGNFLKSRVLGAAGYDIARGIYPLDDGMVFVAGTYNAAGPANGEFPSVYLGHDDVFTARIAPWTVSISEEQNVANRIQVYPNPVFDELFIDAGGNAQIFIADVTGRKVYSGYSASNTKINTSHWLPGVFIVCVEDEKGNKTYQKISKR